MDPRFQPGILGTNASLLSDLTLLAYLLLIVPAMLVGFVFARRRMFVPHHKLMMTTIILVNWVLIGYVMWFSYREAVAPNLPEGLSSPFNLLPTLHLITGGLAQLLGTYLVIRMWFENVLPEWVKVKKIKRYMRATLALWLVTASLGVALYLNWNVPTASAGGAEPVATEEAGESEPDDAATPEPAATEEAGEGEADPDAATPEPAITEEASVEDEESDEASAATPEPAATEEVAPAETEES